MPDPYIRAIDPDLDHTDATLDVPPHPRIHRITFHRLVTVALIGMGGAAGTLARAALKTASPTLGHTIPWMTLGINVAGAGLLGALLSWLACSGPDQGWRRRVRLTLGTGLLGGFTTYSAFSVETVSLLRSGSYWLGIAYALLSLVLSFLAVLAGARLGGVLFERRTGPRILEEAE